MDDELLDLVDENDIVIGTINRKDYDVLIKQKLGYIRAADLFILNDKGKIWIPIRTADKTIAPSGFDFSVGGHVASGEGYLQTIIRETKEEINLDISEDDIKLVIKTKSDAIKYIRCIYLLRSNQTPNFNPDDFVSAKWLAPSELIKEIDNGHAAKTSLRESVIMLQKYLGNEDVQNK